MLRKISMLCTLLIVFFSCSPESNSDTKKDKKNVSENIHSPDNNSTDATQTPANGTTNLLKKVLVNNDIRTELEYQNGKVSRYVANDIFTFQYENNSLKTIEVWEESFDDEMIKIGERVYSYKNGLPEKIVEYEIDEGKKEAVYRTELYYENGLLTQIKVFDLFEEETLDLISKYTYTEGKITSIQNFNDNTEAYESIDIEYENALNPYAQPGLEYFFDEFEPIFKWVISRRTTTKKKSGTTVTEEWKNSFSEDGILQQSELITARSQEKHICEFQYQ